MTMDIGNVARVYECVTSELRENSTEHSTNAIANRKRMFIEMIYQNIDIYLSLRIFIAEMRLCEEDEL